MGAGPGSSIPLPKAVTPSQVRRESRSHSKQIFESYALLKGIAERHESTIHKRYAKKTRKQRNEVLLAAWPGMAAIHRPDFDAFKKENERQRDAGTKFKDAYMWPYINLEDLSKPRPLLLMIQSRARTPPDHFAAADYEAAHLGLVSKAIQPVFLNEHTMMFTGRTSPET